MRTPADGRSLAKLTMTLAALQCSLSSESRSSCAGADLGGGGGRGGHGPPFQFVGDLFFVKIYNNFIIL